MVTTGNTDIEFDVRLSDAPLAAGERGRALAAPGFGEVFTDHMITIRWTEADGWHDARLEPYGPFTLDPATSVFLRAGDLEG
jgi:branched-chain amino acid aminotransferase